MTAQPLRFSGAVLAGGASTRMGTDKALIEIDGRPMAVIAAEALGEAGAAEVFFVGGDAPALEALSLRVVADHYPGAGPLGGVITALRSAAHDTVAVLSCDLLEPSGVGIAAMVGALGTGHVAVPVVDGISQWHHTAWRRTALPHLEATFASGERSPKRAVAGLEVVQILDGNPCWYADADTPEDLPNPH